MGQITIYLDNDAVALVKASVKASGVSQSQWITEAIRQRVRREWPASVRALAGVWPDFLTAEEIRKRQGPET
jgi:Ribbon-helix-helix protein, copG family